MKKIWFLMVLIFGFTLYACETDNLVDDTEDNDDEIIDESGFYGTEDVTLDQGDYFDPYEDVTALDSEGLDITDSIEILGLEHLNIVNDYVQAYGEFLLVYTATSQDGTTFATNRLITVLESDEDDPLAHCGNPVIGDYVITWCDEFTGEGENLNAQGIDLDKWAFQTGTGSQYGLTGWGNNEAQYYREDNARVENGRLIIEAKQESFSGSNYTSARMWTKPTFYQKYGRFEASIRLPVGNGLWPAFWMMPQYDVYGGWAASGEIDIMEARGRQPDRSIAALHFGGSWPNNTHTHQVYYFPAGRSIADFNVYAVEWEEDEIRWYVNDNLVKMSRLWFTEGHDFPAPFDQEFYLLLNLAIGGSFDDGRLPDDSLFDNPVLMEVEYVRVYQKNESE